MRGQMVQQCTLISWAVGALTSHGNDTSLTRRGERVRRTGLGNMSVLVLGDAVTPSGHEAIGTHPSHRTTDKFYTPVSGVSPLGGIPLEAGIGIIMRMGGPHADLSHEKARSICFRDFSRLV
ncbi:hypothetical protein GE09DRAFT_1152694 [Coniochaeta sp. 2T2.1]|nr:hypothetical protein GE09DRAFT_1152694 [Coniochaeta sp. 2T2.1]